MPADVPDDKALELFDVCAAASQVRSLAPGARTVCVLGAGHAGKLSLAAARDAAPDATLVCVDVDAAAVERGRGARPLRHRASPPTCATRSPRWRRSATPASAPADLTVVVVNATRLRAGGGPADRRRRHRPLLLDGDALLGRGACRRRPRRRAADDRRQRLRARPRRLRARARPRLGGAARGARDRDGGGA